MNKALAASKRSNLLELLIPHSAIPTNHLRSPALRRHCTTESDELRPPPDQSLVTQVVSLIESNGNDWTSSDELRKLLFDSPHALSPHSVLRINRRLGTTAKALQFFDYFRTNSPSPPDPHVFSFAFEAIFELGSREQPQSHTRLYEHFTASKDLNVPLSINSAILLIRTFGRVGMVKESLVVYSELVPELRNTQVRNALLDVLMLSGCIDDALKLLDEMLKPETRNPPNDKTMNTALVAVMKRDWSGRTVKDDEIVELVLKFGKRGLFPNEFLLCQVITRLCRSGRTDTAWDLLHDLIKLGDDVETASCNALLTGLGRARDFQRMNVLMKEMKQNEIQPNVVTFGILINHLCKFRRVDDALEVFEKMSGGSENSGISVEPDTILYNTLIDGLCKVGRQEEGLALMERMKSQPCCKPNSVTYNCLIDGFCKSGEIDKARGLLDQMTKEGVPVNVITLNSLVGGMCKYGRLNSAIEFVNEMQGKGVKGNAVTYTALISAFCNVNNIGKAMSLFDDMVESGCSLDAIVYYTLISGLARAGQTDEASSLADTMKKAGFRLDVVCYNVLIGGFCKKNKPDKAHEMLKEMEQAGVKPDGVTYNTLISFFSETGDFATARRVMSKMKNDGLVPTVVTYGALIHGYCLAGNLDEAIKVFNDMSSASRVLPNTVIYNILIDSHCKNNKVETALSQLGDMRSKGVRPNATTYNALFKGLEEMNWFEKSLELMDQMTENACNPDYVTMEILTNWLPAIGEVEKLRRFVQGYDVSASTT